MHSSLRHKSVSAVMTAARLVAWIDDLQAKTQAAPLAGAVAAVVSNWSALHVARAEHAEKRLRVHRSGAHLDVEGLVNETAS